MSTGTRPPGRPLELLRGGWGLALLCAPGPIASRIGAAPPGRGERAVFRVLGARHLVQALASGASPGPAVLAVGAWVDTAHSLSGVLFAAVDRRHARTALVDATIAATWALASRAATSRARADPDAVRRGGWRERVAAALLPHLPGAPR